MAKKLLPPEELRGVRLRKPRAKADKLPSEKRQRRKPAKPKLTPTRERNSFRRFCLEMERQVDNELRAAREAWKRGADAAGVADGEEYTLRWHWWLEMDKKGRMAEYHAGWPELDAQSRIALYHAAMEACGWPVKAKPPLWLRKKLAAAKAASGE